MGGWRHAQICLELLNSRATRDWPQRGKVQDVLCKSSVLTICYKVKRDDAAQLAVHEEVDGGQSMRLGC